MSIYMKLGKVQCELKAPKGQTNNFGGYKYRSCEDILEAVKPLLTKNCLVLQLSDEIEEVGGRVYVKATARLVDAETGEAVENTAFAREEETKKGMDSSQITGASSSYARKYALNGLFAIDDTKDSDATNTGESERVERRITKEQITQLKNLGFDEARLDEMAKYFKKPKIEDVTYSQAEMVLKKKKAEV